MKDLIIFKAFLEQTETLLPLINESRLCVVFYLNTCRLIHRLTHRHTDHTHRQTQDMYVKAVINCLFLKTGYSQFKPCLLMCAYLKFRVELPNRGTSTDNQPQQ